MAMRSVTWCALLMILPLAAEIEAQPLVTNARALRIEMRTDLGSTIQELVRKSEGPAWLAWQVPAAARMDACCWDDDCRGCRLEPVASGTTAAPIAAPQLALEGDTTFWVLVRVAGGQLDRLRTVAASCPLDAGGLPFTTLTRVSPAASVAWLRSLLEGNALTGMKRPAEGAIHAIARHADPTVVPMLLDLARAHAASKIRGAALVALAQAAGRRIAPELTRAIEDDASTEVKKRAVFALSRLPNDESVPILIRLAREHQNVEVRRQAVFWLGQSKDARAIDFFATVLK
jgi:hypothetical protein